MGQYLRCASRVLRGYFTRVGKRTVALAPWTGSGSAYGGRSVCTLIIADYPKRVQVHISSSSLSVVRSPTWGFRHSHGRLYWRASAVRSVKCWEAAMTAILSNSKIRLTHIITGLDVGGAETMLSKLVSQQDRSQFDLDVICLQPNGPIGARIEGMGIRVRSLELRSAKGTLHAMGKLAGWLRRSRPDIVQTWLYHADLIGGIAARLARVRAVAWNIRNGTLDQKGTKRSTVRVVRMLARLSRSLPARIVCCSESSHRIAQ